MTPRGFTWSEVAFNRSEAASIGLKWLCVTSHGRRISKLLKMLKHSPIFDGPLPGEDAQSADMRLLS